MVHVCQQGYYQTVSPCRPFFYTPKSFASCTDKVLFVGVEGPKTPAPPLAANTADVAEALGHAVCSLCQYN